MGEHENCGNTGTILNPKPSNGVLNPKPALSVTSFSKLFSCVPWGNGPGYSSGWALPCPTEVCEWLLLTLSLNSKTSILTNNRDSHNNTSTSSNQNNSSCNNIPIINNNYRVLELVKFLGIGLQAQHPAVSVGSVKPRIDRTARQFGFWV